MKHAHAQIIDLWPSAAEFARNLTAALADGKVVTPDNARAMKRQGIPAYYWHGVSKAAEACGFESITYARLSELARAAA